MYDTYMSSRRCKIQCINHITRDAQNSTCLERWYGLCEIDPFLRSHDYEIIQCICLTTVANCSCKWWTLNLIQLAFQVIVTESSGESSESDIPLVNVLTWTSADLSPDTDITVQVRARNGFGEGNLSNSQNIRTKFGGMIWIMHAVWGFWGWYVCTVMAHD